MSPPTVKGLRPVTSLADSVFVDPNFDTEDSLAWFVQYGLAKNTMKAGLTPTVYCKRYHFKSAPAMWLLFEGILNCYVRIESRTRECCPGLARALLLH